MVSERGAILPKLGLALGLLGGLWFGSSEAAITFKQQATATGTKKTTIPVYGSAITGPSFLLMLCGSAGSAANPSSITETGATWIAVVDATAGDNGHIWNALNVASSASTTVTVNWPANTSSGCNASEFIGINTSSATDVSDNAASGNSTSPATNSITTTNANDLVVCLLVYSGGAGNPITAHPSGYTALTQTISGDTTQGEYKIVSATGSQSCTWTITAATPWTAIIAAFKAPNPVSLAARVLSVSQAVMRASTWMIPTSFSDAQPLAFLDSRRRVLSTVKDWIRELRSRAQREREAGRAVIAAILAEQETVTLQERARCQE